MALGGRTVNKTFGMLRYGPTSAGNRWGIKALPYVASHVKRIFPRADATSPGVVFFTDTPAVARDIEWVMQRYPLEADPATLAYLKQRADEGRRIEEAVHDILSGYTPPDKWRDPAVRPRDYQLEADAIVHATGRCLIADDLGLGKTFSASLRLRDPEALPAAVVVPAQIPRQWQARIGEYLPWLRTHIVSRRDPYDPADKCGGRQPDVLILSYAKFAEWGDYLAGQVQTVIFDEAQELRTGSGTTKYAAACNVAWKARYRIELTATPVYNYGDEIWSLINVIDPDFLGSRTEFKREWCGADAGLARHAVVKDPAMLGGYLRDSGIMLVRTRKQTHRELPDPVQIEQVVDTDHAEIDQVAADVAEHARLLVSGKGTFQDRGKAALDLDWRMRQATGVAKAPYVAEFCKLLLETEKRIVLCGWHREVYSTWLAALAGYNPVLYTGSESPAQKQASVDKFLHGDARVLIMSLRSGAGLDGLQENCSVMVFGELDWSPMMHTQCLGRLNRDGQDSTVVAYFMVSDDGTDPLMCDTLGIKRSQAIPLRDPDTPLFTQLTPENDRARKLAAAVLRRVSRKGPAHATRR